MIDLCMSGFLLSLSLCLDLGIVNVALIKTGLERGLVPSFLVGLGSSFGDLIYAGLSMVGMSLLMQLSVVRWILWIGGTLVLLYLSLNMVQETVRPRNLHVTPDGLARSDNSRIKLFLTGVGLALSSPSSILWFAAVGGSVIAATAHHYQIDTLVAFFIAFFCAGVLWSFVVAYISGQVRKIMGTQVIRLLSLVSAVLFIYFACRVFLNGLHTLL
ncbi:LysE family translocator [Alicyclobacillus kakegawensis]|uniref:LysE family translocator n=1 Tax=Alicyclobacillus kakegawensis TaxID=392012 RepID=UPI000AE75175|nr:LysE family transporter [Alicyclobacillus kakegawensis]